MIGSEEGQLRRNYAKIGPLHTDYEDDHLNFVVVMSPSSLMPTPCCDESLPVFMSKSSSKEKMCSTGMSNLEAERRQSGKQASTSLEDNPAASNAAAILSLASDTVRCASYWTLA